MNHILTYIRLNMDLFRLHKVILDSFCVDFIVVS
jgi:hypothetical protein